MQFKTHMLPAACFVIAFSSAAVLAQTMSEDPTQLGTRQIEVRNLDAGYDIAYRSAMQALLSLGYSISHSDKTSGILTGSRTVGVTQMREDVKKAKDEMKDYQEQVQKETTARTALGFVPYVGWLAWLVPGSKPPEQNIKEPTNLQITMLLHSMGNKETQRRSVSRCKKTASQSGIRRVSTVSGSRLKEKP